MKEMSLKRRERRRKQMKEIALKKGKENKQK